MTAARLITWASCVPGNPIGRALAAIYIDFYSLNSPGYLGDLPRDSAGDLSAAWSIFAEILLQEKISCAFGANSTAFVSGIIQLLGTKLPTMKKRSLAVSVLVRQKMNIF